jgi:hypothetical protein
MELDKGKRIKREVTRLNRVFRGLDKDRKVLADKVIRQAAFMAVTLEDLQDHINEHGTVSEYQNGENQWGTKKSPEVEIYNTMIGKYGAAIKQLCDLLPPQEGKTAADELLDFVKQAGRR